MRKGHLFFPLEKKTLALSRAWGAVSHLMSVCDEPELRKAYNEALPIVTQFWIGLSQSTLSQKYKAIKESDEFKNLSPVRQRIINEELIDFKLAGAFLPEEKKTQLEKALSDLISLAPVLREFASTTDYRPHTIYTLLDPDRVECLYNDLKEKLHGYV